MLLFLSLMLSNATAQEAAAGEIPQFNAQSFRPAVDSLQFLWLNDTSLGKDDTLNFRTTLSYADSPITYYDYTGTRYELLSSVTQMDISAGYTHNRFRYALSAPVILYAPGETVPGIESGSVAPVGLGEMMADVKYQILNRYNKKVGLAITGRSSLPTTTTGSPLGTDGIMFEVETGLDTEIKGITLAMNLGHRQQPEVPTESVSWGSQLFGRTGLAKPFDENHSKGVSAELSYATLYSGIGEDYATAAEGMLGGWFTVAKYYQFRAGLGKGLSRGMTTPNWRGVVSVSFLKKPPPDTDADGIIDKIDQCPEDPEDFDGFMDEEGCPDPTKVTVRIVSKDGEELPEMLWKSGDGVFSGTDGDTFMMQAGKIGLSVSHADYKPAEIVAKIIDQETQEVTIEMELRMGSLKLVAENEEGEKVPDATWEIKGFMGDPNEAEEAIPLRPGQYEVVIKAPDYKIETRTVTIKKDETETIVLAMKPAKVKITDVKLEILDKVYFKTGSYEIDEKSDLLLNEVADVLKHYPNILQVRIEGHTDSQGKARYNKTLSQGRADEVKKYLVAKGIEPTRLTPQGFGEEQPIADNKTKAGRSMNRRVIFVITDSIPMSEFKIQNSAEGEMKQDGLQSGDHALDLIKKKLDQEAKENKEKSEEGTEGEKSEDSEKKDSEETTKPNENKDNE